MNAESLANLTGPKNKQQSMPKGREPEADTTEEACGFVNRQQLAGLMLKANGTWRGINYGMICSHVELSEGEDEITFDYECSRNGLQRVTITGKGLFEIARHLTQAKRETLHPGGQVSGIAAVKIEEEK